MDELLPLAQSAGLAGGSPGLPTDEPGQAPLEGCLRLARELQKTYGQRGASGLAQRAGRELFRLGLAVHGDDLGLTALPHRLLPLQTRLEDGCRRLAVLLNGPAAEWLRLDLEPGRVRFLIADRRLQCETVGRLLAGLLQEAFSWAGGGRIFRVELVDRSAEPEQAIAVVMDRIPLG